MWVLKWVSTSNGVPGVVFLNFTLLVITSKSPAPPPAPLMHHLCQQLVPARQRTTVLTLLFTCSQRTNIFVFSTAGMQFSTWSSYLRTANILEVNGMPLGWDEYINLNNYESGNDWVKIHWFDNLLIKLTGSQNRSSLFQETKIFGVENMSCKGEILEMKTKVLCSVGYPDVIYCWSPSPGATSFYLYALGEIQLFFFSLDDIRR